MHQEDLNLSFEFFWLSFDELDSFSLLVLVLPVDCCFVVVIGL